MRCRCCTDAASQHEQIQGTAVWRVGSWVHAHTYIERAQRYFKLSSSCIVALVLRYRAAWDNKHVCVCATGHLEHWKLHGFPRSWTLNSTRRAGAGTLQPAPSGPRGPQTRARAGRGRDQSDGPSGRSGAVRALFHVLTNLLITRSQLSLYARLRALTLFTGRITSSLHRRTWDVGPRSSPDLHADL